MIAIAKSNIFRYSFFTTMIPFFALGYILSWWFHLSMCFLKQPITVSVCMLVHVYGEHTSIEMSIHDHLGTQIHPSRTLPSFSMDWLFRLFFQTNIVYPKRFAGNSKYRPLNSAMLVIKVYIWNIWEKMECTWAWKLVLWIYERHK